MLCMSNATYGYALRLEGALERRGSPLSVDAFLDILREASETTSEALSAGERSFLLENTDLTEEDLTPQARAASRDRVASDRAVAEEEARASSLMTGEVAGLLGRQEASIRRSKANGDLYALPVSGGRASRFPAWQFGGQQVVPGLREILPAFPRYFHPLSIQRFMTTPHEELDEQTPVQWLLEGGSVDAVVTLADELNFV